MNATIFKINYADNNAWNGAHEIDYSELDRAVSLGPVELQVYDPDERGYWGRAGHFRFPAGLNSPAGHKVVVRNMEDRPIVFHGTRKNRLPDEGAQSWTDDRTENIDWWIVNESPVVEIDGGMWGGFVAQGWRRGAIRHVGQGVYRHIKAFDNGRALRGTVEVTGRSGFINQHDDACVRLENGHATFENVEFVDAAADIFQAAVTTRIENLVVRNFVFSYRPHPARKRAYNDTTHPDMFQTYKNGTVVRDVLFENGIMGPARQWFIFGNAGRIERVKLKNVICSDAYGIGFRVGDECDLFELENCTIYTSDRNLLLFSAESSRRGQLRLKDTLLYAADGQFNTRLDGNVRIHTENVVSNKAVGGMDGIAVKPIEFAQLPSEFGLLDFDFGNEIGTGATIYTVADVTGEAEPPIVVAIQPELEALQRQVTALDQQVVALNGQVADLNDQLASRDRHMHELQVEIMALKQQVMLIAEQMTARNEQIKLTEHKLVRLENWAGGFGD